MIRISVIIVLFNEYELVKKTLSSIYQSKVKDMEVVLVDNSSERKGYENLLEKFPNVIYIHNKKNEGFGAGVNVGVKKSRGEYILMLTPDMYILPGTIVDTLSYIEKNDNVGLVGSRIFASPNVQEASILARFPDLLTQLYYYNMLFYKLIIKIYKEFNPLYKPLSEHKKIHFAKALSGQYMLIRKKAIVQIGYFDNRFFLYFEDVDLCRRLRKNNWEVVYLPVGGVVQNGISKWKENVRITQSLIPYMRSLYRFFLKHNGRMYTIVAWFVAAFSAVITIPFLVATMLIKLFFQKKSQSQELLPLWIRIVRWHFTEGIVLVLTNKK